MYEYDVIYIGESVSDTSRIAVNVPSCNHQPSVRVGTLGVIMPSLDRSLSERRNLNSVANENLKYVDLLSVGISRHDLNNQLKWQVVKARLLSIRLR
jgi:hypothetical protein